MGMRSTTALVLVLLIQLSLGEAATVSNGTTDGKERWGYVEIRPKANLFWWFYRSSQRVSTPEQPWPTILWLQGGPGQSGTGNGNFQEIGALDVDLKPRNSTWLQKADLIFVDNPVGVGYSYVEDESALVKTDLEAAADLTELLKALVKELPTLQSSPLFLVGESYDGKLAAMTGVSVARAIRAGTLKITLGGVVLGDSWISPDDHALSYPWLLKDVSRLDDNAVGKAIMMAVTVKQQMVSGQFAAAYKTWVDLLDLIDAKSGNINMENFMVDNTVSSAVLSYLLTRPSSSSPGSSRVAMDGTNTISGILNGVIKQKLKIIPKNITWQDVSLQVFDALTNDFMKPAINEAIDELLSYGVNVTVYQGQLDVICSTLGTEAWVKRLKWEGLHNFFSLPRKPLHYCHPYYLTNGFVQSYKNLHFYWILGAGHTVPVDKPCTALYMIGSIVQSPASYDG
ncbi:serine carboxypeptidase-like 51 [Miscanthus floridulus]|uniref:serine carboxypeptidase-like 51 n=1 Tax=Miscanthus floridulus TaxID=154761 RepID=UPI003459F738